MNNNVIAYRRWNDGKIKFGVKDIDKASTIVCVGCHNFETNNDERDSAIVYHSETGRTILNGMKCGTCGDMMPTQRP